MCSFLNGKGPKYRGFCVRLSPKITLAEEKERKNREEQKGRRIENMLILHSQVLFWSRF